MEGLVKLTASAEVKMEHLEAEGRKLLFPSSLLMPGSEGSRVSRTATKRLQNWPSC